MKSEKKGMISFIIHNSAFIIQKDPAAEGDLAFLVFNFYLFSL